MDQEIGEKKNLFNTSATIVGLLVGAGIFLKSTKVVSEVSGNIYLYVAVIVTLCVCAIIYSRTFSTLAIKYPKATGLVDFAEIAVGPRYSYFCAWFMATMYYPIIAATLTYIAARYLCMIFNIEPYGQTHMAISFLFMALSIVYNVLNSRPKGFVYPLATQIKCLPLVVMGVWGICYGIKNGTINLAEDLTLIKEISNNGGFFTALCAGTFLYEGWGFATTVRDELKGPNKQLKKGLTLAIVNVALMYLLYSFGIAASTNTYEVIGSGNQLPLIVFSNLAGPVGGTIFIVFVCLICLTSASNATNACMKGYYHISRKNQGLMRNSLNELNSHGISANSCLLGGLSYCFWLFQISLLFFNGPLVTGATGNPLWLLGWELDEAIIVNEYMLYVPIVICILIKGKDLSVFERFVLPILSVGISAVLVYSWWHAYGTRLVIYHLLLVALIMGFGMLFYKKDRNISFEERTKREVRF